MSCMERVALHGDKDEGTRGQTRRSKETVFRVQFRFILSLVGKPMVKDIPAVTTQPLLRHNISKTTLCDIFLRHRVWLERDFRYF